MKKTLITLAVVLTAVSAANASTMNSSASGGLIDLFAEDTPIQLKFDMDDLQQVDESAVISGVLANSCLYWDLALESYSSGLIFDTSGVTMYNTGSIDYSSDTVAMSDSASWFRPVPAGTVFDGLGLEGAGVVRVYNYTGSEDSYVGSFEVVPEPSMMVLLGIGGLILNRRRK